MKKILILLSISLLTITMITKNVSLVKGEVTSQIVPTTTENAVVEEEKNVGEATGEEETTPEVEMPKEQSEVLVEEEGMDAELSAEEDSEKNVDGEELIEASEDDIEEESAEGENKTDGELSESEIAESELPEGELPEGELSEGELPEGENKETDLQESEQVSSDAPAMMIVGAGNPLAQPVGANKEIFLEADDIFVIEADGWELEEDVYVKKQERFSTDPMSPNIGIITDEELEAKSFTYSFVDNVVSYKYYKDGEEIQEPHEPGSYEKVASVKVRHGLVIKRTDEFSISVKFRIDGIKVVSITNDETVTYTGDVVIPKLYVTDTGNNKKTLEYGKDYYLTETLLGGEVKSINASEDNYYAYAVFTQEFRNQHWSFDWDADKDLFVKLISYKIDKRDVYVSNTKEFEYNKAYITPEAFVFDNDANKIVIIKHDYDSEDYSNYDYQIVNVKKKYGASIEEGKPMDAGTYTAEIQFSEEFLGNNNIVPGRGVTLTEDGNYPIQYVINQKKVKFSDWNSSEPINIGEKVFLWQGDENGRNAKLIFNGYNPTLFGAFPTANFVDLYDDPIDDEDLTCTVKPTSTLDGIGHHLVNINLTNNNYKLVGEGDFTIVQKPVMIKWTNTIIDVKSFDKVPNAKIVEINDPTLSGIVSSDNGKVFIDYDYYRIVNGNPIKVLIPPTEEGDYIVEAKIYNKALVPTLCLNYSYGDTYQTRYQIVDMSTSHEGDINTGTINKIEEDVTLDLLGFEGEQAKVFVENLPNEEIREVLEKAIEKNKDINLYIVATDADASRLTLPNGADEVICIDIQLFATIEGDTNKYQIEDTGANPISILFTVTPQEAEKIGYNSNKLFYVARYHGDTENPVVSQENPTVDGDGNFQFVYESNKFSDFVIYTKDKPVVPENKPVVADESDVRKNSHLVINTGD